ncbi:MAG TPA: hypothetical protein VMH87_14805 [Pseudomonadales bacterium]|nr:hypothetical protein [Pseudomonadales bacterium]
MKKEKPIVLFVSAIIVLLVKIILHHYSVGHPVLSWLIPLLIVFIGITWWYMTKIHRNNSN